MIANLKPYAKYKESGLPWLAGIAPGWRTLRGKGVFSAVDVRSETGKEELLSVSASDGVVPRSQKAVTMFKAKSYVGHKLCWPGDLVVNSLWAWMQGLGVSRYHGLISSAYSVYRPRQEFTDYGRFFHYLLRSAAYKWELQTRSKGVWLSRLQLLDLTFMDMPILLPPPDEQAAIVRFLNYVNHRIDRTIRAKKKVIALLNEQKQAIIHRAVTCGLDPNVPLKPSGIPWLGDIPEHWEVYQARHIGRLLKGSGGSKEDVVAEGVPCVRYGDLYTRYNNFIRHARTFVSPERATNYTPILYGDVLFAASGEKIEEIGKSAVNLMKNAAVCGGDVVILRITVTVHAPFLGYAFDSHGAAHQKATMCRGTTIKHIYPDELRGLQVPFPPLNEQEQIATSLDAELLRLNKAISRTEREISLLREYRTRLIADVVTGKLDVREAAKKLPDEAAESGIIDDDETPAGDEEMTDSINGEGDEL